MTITDELRAQRDIRLAQAVVCQFIVEKGGIVDDDDARAVAHRLISAGFELADPTRDFQMQEHEARLAALEGWSGLSRHRT